MKAPRIAVVIANLKNEHDILKSIVGASPEQIQQHIDVLAACISRLEPNGAPPSAPKVTRTRKAQPRIDSNVGSEDPKS